MRWGTTYKASTTSPTDNLLIIVQDMRYQPRHHQRMIFLAFLDSLPPRSRMKHSSIEHTTELATHSSTSSSMKTLTPIPSTPPTLPPPTTSKYKSQSAPAPEPPPSTRTPASSLHKTASSTAQSKPGRPQTPQPPSAVSSTPSQPATATSEPPPTSAPWSTW